MIHRRGIFIAVLLFGFLFCRVADAQVSYPAFLWKGLVAEDTSGDRQIYFHLAHCVKNKLRRERRTGLVALKRRQLDKFLTKEMNFAKSKSGGRKDLRARAEAAIEKAFIKREPDPTNGADHYEHTGKYPKPWWAKNGRMTITKVLYPGTKQEITFYKKVSLRKGKKS